MLALGIALPGARAEKFTLVVLPDTQIAVRARPELTHSQMEWIVSNRAARNIPFVLHVGDVVDWDTPELEQWVTASACFERLDEARIPYAIAVGNHDTAAVQPGGAAAPGDVRANLRVTDSFNRFFPVGRFTAQGGRMEAGKSDNAWYAFRAGGVDWLVVALELWARPAPVEWANGIVAAHPHHNVIVLTHSHLNSRGEIETRNGGYGDQSPRHIYEHFVAKHANVRFVFSGHVGDSAWREDLGEHGNRIIQILQCYQNRDAGGAYLRLVEIDPEAGTVEASMYSPFHDKAPDDGSGFSFDQVNLVRPAK